MNNSFNNPAEKQGLVVANATLDREEIRCRLATKSKMSHKDVKVCAQNVNDNILTVMPHDLTFRDRTRRAISRKYNDTEIHVMASTNGMGIRDQMLSSKNETDEATRKRKRSDLEFAGVAVTKAVFQRNQNANAHEMNLPVQIGGVCTIQNTGKAPIHVGDLVVWDLPKGKDEGKGFRGCKEKQHFITRPYEISDNNGSASRKHYYSKEHLKEDMKKLAGGSETDVPAFVKTLYDNKDNLEAFLNSDFVDEFHSFVDEQRSRIIGKALSSASGGQVFDIMLGHYAA